MQPRALNPFRPLRSVSRSLRAPEAVRSPSFVCQRASITTSPPKKQEAAAKAPPRQIKPVYARSKPANTTRGQTRNPYSTNPNNAFASSAAEEAQTLDPQAAVPPAASVEDVDPQLAGAIATPSNEGRAISDAFAAALSNGANAGGAGATIDWSSSFHGLSTTPFSPEVAAILMKPLEQDDIEVKPDGIIYLPEIKYRRILNQAFGPGGWGLAPRGELAVGEKVVTREFALIVNGRFVAQARGECQYFSEETIPTAGEGCKSNALLRCCKDLGIASELWDPRFIRQFKKANCKEVWVEHVVNKKKRQIWIRNGVDPAYPYALARSTTARPATKSI